MGGETSGACPLATVLPKLSRSRLSLSFVPCPSSASSTPASTTCRASRSTSPPRADRHHRALGLREELARVRHPLRRGPAALHRVALHLRQAVPRAHAEAAGGPARGDRAGGRHRAAESHRVAAAPPSAPPPRCTTTCACSGRGSARRYCRVCGAPVRRDTPQSARPTTCSRAGSTRAAAGRVSAARRRRALTHAAGGREPARARASSACVADGDRLPPRRAAGRRSTSPGGEELLVVVDRLVADAPATDAPADSPRRSPPPSRKARGWRSCCTVHGPRPAALHRVSRLQRLRHAGAARSRPRSSPSTIRAAPAPTCNGFGAVLEYDESLIVPDPDAQSRRRRDRSLDQAALRDTAAAPARQARESSAPIRTRRGTSSRPPSAGSCCYGKQGPLRRHLPLPQGARGEALQAVHPRLPPAVPAGQDLPERAAAPG